MGTVASNLSRLANLEGTLTSVSIGGGAGATANTDIFIQASQSLGRRQSGVTLSGFLNDRATGVNVSAAGTHIGLWMWVTHYSVLTALRARFAGNNGSANYHEHALPLTEYPVTGGWVRVWVDISRTPEATGGTGFQKTTCRYFGPIVSLPTVGGNAQNVILDAVDYTTTGLTITGSSSTFQDFVTSDNNTTNRYGVISSQSGIYFCRARLTIGTATSVQFSNTDFVMVFPQQALVSTTFMGVTIDLQNASSVVDLLNGSFQSPGARKGDLIVTGTAGASEISGCVMTGLRAITLTSAVTFLANVIQATGTVTQSSATITDCSFINSTATAALVVNNISSVTDTSFTSSGTGHAIEGFSTAGSYTLTNLFFTGYAASNGSTGNEAIYVTATSGTVTLNISGGSTPTIRTAGATVSVVTGSVTLTITANVSLLGAEVRIYDLNNSPAGSYGTELSGVESNSSSTYVYSGIANNLILIQVMKTGYEEFTLEYTIPTTSVTLDIKLTQDKNL